MDDTLIVFFSFPYLFGPELYRTDGEIFVLYYFTRKMLCVIMKYSILV